VQPILKASCYSCHGPEQQLGGLRLDSQQAALAGGASGKAIQPGKGTDSLLMRRVLGQGGRPRMPLGFAPLPPKKTDLLRAWIDQGAHWTQSPGPAQVHWAYIKPVRPKVPASGGGWARNPIDSFVQEKIDRVGLRHSPAASRETLLRRAFLDLTGLPPTPSDVDSFLADKKPGAYERVVDRLLASPHFGERWARPWLDLARYADTNGYEKDGRRSIWKYRDWVINALNSDMPYDRFTVEQIAGDLLPHATDDQRVATGFHRNTLLNEEGGVDKDEQRWLTQVDRVGTTATVWLGSTIACAQCHNHKYDPFSQKEFYSLLAFFDHTTEPDLSLPTPQQERRQEELRTAIAEQNALLSKLGPTGEAAAVKAAKDRKEGLQRELNGLPIATTLVMRELEDGKTPSTYLRVKGSFLAKGDLVEAGTPAILNPFPTDQPQNRLGLARWLVSPDNPLTARVEVNRLWEQLFGRGLVETSEDFGTQGSPPSHPELLDWLATEFQRRRWSTKAMLRLMVTSATYRQSSRVTPELLEKDPSNILLACGPRFRLEAEMIRDQSLAVAGMLDPQIGGPSVFPLQPEGIWDIPYSDDRWTTSEGTQRYRRGLYTFWRRTSPYPAFVTFDASSREFCTVRRVRTNTPLQALTTLNDEAFLATARGLARRMVAECGATPADRVTYGFRLCTARRPTSSERARLLSLYARELARYRSDRPAAATLCGQTDATDPGQQAAMTVLANVLLNLDETLTKE
jgi:hypothetical protein